MTHRLAKIKVIKTQISLCVDSTCECRSACCCLIFSVRVDCFSCSIKTAFLNDCTLNAPSVDWLVTTKGVSNLKSRSFYVDFVRMSQLKLRRNTDFSDCCGVKMRSSLSVMMRFATLSCFYSVLYLVGVTSLNVDTFYRFLSMQPSKRILFLLTKFSFAVFSMFDLDSPTKKLLPINRFLVISI